MTKISVRYNDKLAQDYEVISGKVRRGMLPLVARNPAIAKAVGEYAVAQAHHYDAKREKGENPPINYKDSDALDRFADLILYEELTWSHPDKMSIVEFPVVSDRNEKSYRDKYSPNSDLQYGDRRYMGRRKTHFTDNDGVPQVRNSRVVDLRDPMIERIDANFDLYGALDNAGLTVRQREAIDLVYFDDMTHEVAGASMGVSRRAVGQFVDAALIKLHEYMTKD